jgi:hypothetical protein
MSTAPDPARRGIPAKHAPYGMRLFGYLLVAGGLNVAIWAAGYQGNVGWLVLAVALNVLGALVIVFAHLQARGARSQLSRVPLDRLLESTVMWTANPEAKDQYSTEAADARWELHVELSNQGARYIVEANRRAVWEGAYLPAGWVLGGKREE